MHINIIFGMSFMVYDVCVGSWFGLCLCDYRREIEVENYEIFLVLV